MPAPPPARRPARRQRPSCQPLGQATPLGELEREVRAALHLAEGVDGDDVGMADPGDGLCLGREPPALVRRGKGGLGDRLDRHDAVEPPLDRSVDDPHPALAHLLQDLVAVEAPQRQSGWHRSAPSRIVVPPARAPATDPIICSTVNWCKSASDHAGNRRRNSAGSGDSPSSRRIVNSW